MIRKLLMGTSAALVATGTALAHDWDRNEDGLIDRDEYRQGVADSEVFLASDADGDGMISADEFHDHTFSRFNEDQDDMWSESELQVGNDAMRSGAEVSQ